MTNARKHVTIYTDGGCDPNPGPGGYGVVLIYNNTHKELSGGFRYTTNNRMELYAAISALEALKEPCRITLHSDSQYLVHAITKGWARKWQQNNWQRTKKEKALNPDLWARLLAACDKHDVTFVWVKGHAGNVHNERCDTLAVQSTHQNDLPPDVGYEDASAPRNKRKTHPTLSSRRNHRP